MLMLTRKDTKGFVTSSDALVVCSTGRSNFDRQEYGDQRLADTSPVWARLDEGSIWVEDGESTNCWDSPSNRLAASNLGRRWRDWRDGDRLKMEI